MDKFNEFKQFNETDIRPEKFDEEHNKVNLEDINIEKSSGFKSLDQSAINSIKKLSEFASAPFESKNKLFTFILPINYELEN